MSKRRSQLAAATTRTSTQRIAADPTRGISWFCNTRSSLTCVPQRHIADFVQKQRAPVGRFEQAHFVERSAGDGPLDVSEQFTFKESFDNRRDIADNERARCGGTEPVQGSRHQLLAGPRRSCDEDRPEMGRHTANPGKQLQQAHPAYRGAGPSVTCARSSGRTHLAKAARTWPGVRAR